MAKMAINHDVDIDAVAQRIADELEAAGKDLAGAQRHQREAERALAEYLAARQWERYEEVRRNIERERRWIGRGC